MTRKEHEAKKEVLCNAVTDFLRQYREGLISFAEMRAAIYNNLYTPEAAAIETIDDELIDARIAYDTTVNAILGNEEEA